MSARHLDINAAKSKNQVKKKTPSANVFGCRRRDVLLSPATKSFLLGYGRAEVVRKGRVGMDFLTLRLLNVPLRRQFFLLPPEAEQPVWPLLLSPVSGRGGVGVPKMAVRRIRSLIGDRFEIAPEAVAARSEVGP